MNKIILFASLATTFTHSMETVSLLGMTKTSLNMIYNGTKINLLKEPLSSAANKAKITFVGDKQQELLSGQFDTSSYTVGTIWNACDNLLDSSTRHFGESISLYEKNKDDDSASDDDTYKSYPYNPDNKKEALWKSTYKKTASFIKNVVEPCINQSAEGFIYYSCRRDPNYHWSNNKILLTFTGDEAIEEASKDLDLCYREILRIGAGYYISRSESKIWYTRPQTKQNTTIAIPPLSVDVGFPRDKAAPIAIAAIFNFL